MLLDLVESFFLWTKNGDRVNCLGYDMKGMCSGWC